MKRPKLRNVLSELVIAVLVIAVVTGLLLSAVKNYREIQMKFKTIHYTVQGYEQNEILLAGSSYMEYWKTSEADLGPLHSINVGVAGTKVHHWMENIDTLITPFQPKALVLYVGSNDIDGSEKSKSGADVAKELIDLLNAVHRKLPETQIFFIAITPAPVRASVWNEIEECNRQMQVFAEEKEYISFIDAADVALNADGSSRSELFRSDDLHFNADGYALWSAVIRPVLMEYLMKGETN